MTGEVSASEWISDALDAIERRAASDAPFTADALYRAGLLRSPHPNWPGLAFRLARRRGLIERVGTVYSERRSRAGGSTGLWIAERRW